MTDHYQRIGLEAVAVCGGPSTKLLLYAEVEDGAISADLFFQLPAEQIVRFRFAPEALRESIYEFWESGENSIAPRSWAAMRFVVLGGKFTVDLTYPEQLNPDEGLPERRPLVVAECFPGLIIDYSKPHG